MSFLVGLDPGLTGGVCFMNAEGLVTFCEPMPIIGGEVDVILLDQLVSEEGYPAKVIVEHVQAFAKSAPKSAFTFGRVFETLLTWCKLRGHSYELVRPQLWKAAVLAGTDKSKQAAIAWVRRNHPYLALADRADGPAEAVCLAEYGRRLHLTGGTHD